MLIDLIEGNFTDYPLIKRMFYYSD